MLKNTLLTALCVIAMAANAWAGPAVGETAPDFSATATNGQTVTLSAYADKTVVLEWTNPECPYVVKHYDSGNMQNLQKEAADKGVVWLRVNSGAIGKQGHQTADAANEYVTAKNVAATATILDETGEIGRLYDAKTTPHMFVIEKGKIAYMGAIDDKPTADKADLEGAVNHVSVALAEIASGKPVTVTETKPYGCSVKYAD